MHVCKAFYQQFEWAVADHWRSVSQYPVLVCQGDDDNVTPMAGAEMLVRLLLQQYDSGPSDISDPTNQLTDVSQELLIRDQKDGKSGKLNSSSGSSRIRLVVIEKAGHCLQEERPAEIIAHMEEFFSTVCGLNLPLYNTLPI